MIGQTTAEGPPGDGDLHGGWFLLALDDELAPGLTPLRLGGVNLIAVRDDDGVRVFEATCPHRGAHLGYGGKLDRQCVVCPFHGKRIALGDRSRRWSVGEVRTLHAGAALFARLSGDPGDDRGFEQAIKQAAEELTFVAAVNQRVAVPAEYVVENAFDAEHFSTVHLVPAVRGMRVSMGEHDELVIEGEFRTKAPPWEKERRLNFASRFVARAYSPHLVLTELGTAAAPYTIITGAVPDGTGSVGRVVIGVRPDQKESLPALVHGARYAFDQDRVVWDHLDVRAPQRYDAADTSVIAFRRFCAGFAPAEVTS
ncbi:Rieske-like 2Fe-2S protein [Nonomuraea fuscirosea]|uniref:Rieske-like 2Fe-2S protein n=1 Tax=Nonomuraea fuscirosea TaxID=1291556 RepID=A0A2T0N6Q5_9ACTN|nr:Rieske 2Fe-2S domain-containing protein [Nonomuraea fuscirosea]PRX68243.1 Rieske-like 2Fe-2S protein [Nonomuraea fuscirosea]